MGEAPRKKTKSIASSATQAQIPAQKGEAKFLALLRGINVGGKNVISKDDLKRCFEEIDLTSVRTYIQSGNILFRSPMASIPVITTKIEAALSHRFSYHAKVVVISHQQYKKAVASAPEEWGKSDSWKHNALFTLRGTQSPKILSQLPPLKPSIELAKAVPGVIFWSVLKESQSRTTMMKVASHSLYANLTVRNHNTVYKLLELFEQI